MLLRAFAKINLDLRILGKRQDGYHDLQTVFQTIDWYDQIEIHSAGKFSFSASAGPQDETNLVVRAVRAFENCTGLRVDARIDVKKNLPIGSGLGGGSADAAVTFLALQRFLQRSLPFQEQREALRSLGSDVPFFLHGGCAAGSGRGDEVVPMADSTDYSIVVVDPGIPITSAEAYSWLTTVGRFNSIKGFCVDFAPDSERTPVNDFEAPVFARHPQLAVVRDDLAKNGAFRAALSGSGSAVFGLFRTNNDAELAASILGRRYSVKVTKPLSRAEYFLRMMDE